MKHHMDIKFQMLPIMLALLVGTAVLADGGAATPENVELEEPEAAEVKTELETVEDSDEEGGEFLEIEPAEDDVTYLCGPPICQQDSDCPVPPPFCIATCLHGPANPCGTCIETCL